MIRAVLLAALALSCQPVPQPRPPSPDATDASQPEDAGAEVVDQTDEARRPKKDASAPACHSPCSCACQVLAKFPQCTEGQPTPNGETCEQVCIDTAKIPGVSLPTVCVMNQTSLAKLRSLCHVCGAP